MEIILQPWPWYISGPLIALVMFLLVMLGKNFGMSSNLRTLCALFGAGGRADLFKFDWRGQIWNLIVAGGVVIGGFIGAFLLSPDNAVHINPNTVTSLKALGFQDAGTSYLPARLFSAEAFSDLKTVGLLCLGGFLVGFGSRYAGGCTSGHAISGLSNLQMPSLIAVIGFFAGGLVMVHLIFPFIF
jgi:uncharacterized membrane protein YedE/YeeE